MDVAKLDDLVRAPVEDVGHAMVADRCHHADLAPEFMDPPAEIWVLRARLVQSASQFAGQRARTGIALRRREGGLPSGPIAELLPDPHQLEGTPFARA